MAELTPEYLLLFNAVTDAIEKLEKLVQSCGANLQANICTELDALKSQLIQAQQNAEELYLDAEEQG